MASRESAGEFVWHELMTTDPKAAQAFYKKVVPWSTQAWGGDESYTLWMTPDGPIGGSMALPDEVKSAGAPPHWLCYVGVEDVDAAAAATEKAGGSVVKAPWDIPMVGRVAVLRDPHEAIFCVFTPAGDPPGHEGDPKPGDFSWHELATTDPKAAMSFYGELFGWALQTEMDLGPMGVYRIFGRGETMMGGIYQMPPQIPMPSWLPYAMVESVDAAVEAIGANGGTVAHGPMEVPGGDRVAVAVDPQGAMFAVHAKASG